MEKEQFNVRLPVELKRAAAAVAGALGWSNQELVHVALAELLGRRDELVIVKRKMALQAAKHLKVSFKDADSQSVGLAV